VPERSPHGTSNDQYGTVNYDLSGSVAEWLGRWTREFESWLLRY